MLRKAFNKLEKNGVDNLVRLTRSSDPYCIDYKIDITEMRGNKIWRGMAYGGKYRTTIAELYDKAIASLKPCNEFTTLKKYYV